MPYTGTKIFIGVCLNSYFTLLVMQKVCISLDAKLTKDRNTIIEEIRKTAAK